MRLVSIASDTYEQIRGLSVAYQKLESTAAEIVR